MNLNKGKINFKLIAIILVVIILLTVGGILLFNFIKNRNDGKNPVEEPPIEENKTASELIIVDAIIANTADSKRDIRISMPAISNLSNYAFQQYINKTMSDTVRGYQDEINIVLDENTPSTTKYTYKVDYNRYNNDDYLSIVINQNYRTGGMRSNSWKDTYNIDVKNNREIYLKDLFAPTTDYKTEIVKEINKQAKEKNYELVGGNGLSSIPEKQKFYIEDGVLTIYFDPAAIAPYVYGELHFKMPFKYVNGIFSVI